MFYSLFPKIMSFMVHNFKKFCRAGQATDYNMEQTRCMLDTYGYRHTPNT